MLRSSDLRLGDIRTTVLRGTLPFGQTIEQPGRDLLLFALTGDFILEIQGQEAVEIVQGTTVGLDGGSAAHRWQATTAGPNGTAELFVSSIPRRISMSQRQSSTGVVVPHDAKPYAAILRHAVETQIIVHEDAAFDGDDAVTRRCAEICLIQLVRYGRVRTLEQVDAPAALEGDEHLLRAWSAYFAEPERKWTLQALAGAAGLSRTTFASRFRQVFGAPPLQTLTKLRLEQAETMLRDSRAPLIEIAFTVGYNSEAAFVRAFHRQYGMPPGRFRAGARDGSGR